MRVFSLVLLIGSLFGSGPVYSNIPKSYPYTDAQTKTLIGAGYSHSFFAYKTTLSTAIKKSSYSSYEDPPFLERLEVEDRRIPTGYMLGKQNYYKFPVFLELWLEKPADPKATLESWAKTVLKNRILTGVYKKWPVTWRVQTYEMALKNGNKLIISMLVGSAQGSRYTPAMALQAASTMITTKDHAAVMGTMIASDYNFTSQSLQNRQLILKVFQELSQSMMYSQALSEIKLPRRLTAMEGYLRGKKRFLHASRYSSTVGTMTTTSFADYRMLDIKFKGSNCSVRSDFSTLYSYTQRTILDAPGSDPQSTTTGGSGKKKTSEFSPFEVRQGTGGAYWLVVKLKGGTVFYPFKKYGERKCSKKTVKGLMISNLVEGVYSTMGMWCVHKPSSSIK
ncbi:hypothetical protein KKF34_03645 [Myxococcota bacterium]|nr:hypothetical protein [Myxococcota bacterium]MBU1380591.1 hypothetical protein [Myxococcota bacterium]MBU1495949.1 hypothetical protein [Myxococcota bacterium]